MGGAGGAGSGVPSWRQQHGYLWHGTPSPPQCLLSNQAEPSSQPAACHCNGTPKMHHLSFKAHLHRSHAVHVDRVGAAAGAGRQAVDGDLPAVGSGWDALVSAVRMYGCGKASRSKPTRLPAAEPSSAQPSCAQRSPLPSHNKQPRRRANPPTRTINPSAHQKGRPSHDRQTSRLHFLSLKSGSSRRPGRCV